MALHVPKRITYKLDNANCRSLMNEYRFRAPARQRNRLNFSQVGLTLAPFERKCSTGYAKLENNADQLTKRTQLNGLSLKLPNSKPSTIHFRESRPAPPQRPPSIHHLLQSSALTVKVNWSSWARETAQAKVTARVRVKPPATRIGTTTAETAVTTAEPVSDFCSTFKLQHLRELFSDLVYHLAPLFVRG